MLSRKNDRFYFIKKYLCENRRENGIENLELIYQKKKYPSLLKCWAFDYFNSSRTHFSYSEFAELPEVCGFCEGIILNVQKLHEYDLMRCLLFFSNHIKYFVYQFFTKPNIFSS